MSRSCASCGAPINLLRSHARFCSGTCRVQHHRRTRLPKALTNAPRWVRHDAAKRPLNARTGRCASVTDPTTWATYDTARASSYGVGLGWVLGAGIGCLDLDHCLDDDGFLAPWAQELVDAHRAEALLIEISRSGHGLHIFLPMDPGAGSRLRDGARHIETYPPDSGRYIAVTGHRLEH